MKPIQFGVIWGAFASFTFAQAPQAPGQPIAGEISEITLYQGTAVVSRQVDVPADKLGACEIIIGPLPAATDPTSVYADKVTGATVRSVACRSRPPEEAAKLQGRAGELEKEIDRFNPIARVAALGKAKLPIFIIHGDDDKVVPLKENSQAMQEAYQKIGAAESITLEVVEGQGHNFWEGFFRSQALIDFVIARAKAGN